MSLNTLKKEKQKYFLKKFLEKYKEIKWPYNISEELLNIEVFDYAPSVNIIYPNVEAILRDVDKKEISADILSTFELNNIGKYPNFLARILSAKVMLNYLNGTCLNSAIDKIFNTAAIYADVYDVHDIIENFLNYLEKNMIKNLPEVIKKSNKIVEYLEYPYHYEVSKHLMIFNILIYRSNFDFSPNQLELILNEAVGRTNNEFIYNCHKLIDNSHLPYKVFDGVNEHDFLNLVDFIAVNDKLSESRARWLEYIVNDDSIIQYNLLKNLSIFSKSNLNILYFENSNDNHNETLKYLSDEDTNQILKEQFFNAIKEKVDNVSDNLSLSCESYREKYGEIGYEQYAILLMRKEIFKELSTSQKNYLLKLPKDCCDIEQSLKHSYSIAEILLKRSEDNRKLIDLMAENEDLLDATVESLKKTNYKIRVDKGKILTSLVSKILIDKPSLETYSQFLEYLGGTNACKETYGEDVEQMCIYGNYFQDHNINDTFDKLNKNNNVKIFSKLIKKCNDDISLCQTINLLTNQDIDQDLLNSEILYLTGLNKQYHQGIERITAINIINQSDDENIKSFILSNNKKLPDKGISKVKK